MMEKFSSIRHKWKLMNGSTSKQEGRSRFNRNKFGMFIHWGLYSIPAGVWNGHTMEDGGEGPCVAEWIMRRKKISRNEYARLAEQFYPKGFDADQWVAVAKSAGMKYIIITSKHHEGFAMYDSAVDDFNIIKATPFKRDIVGELHAACQRANIDFGVYYSHALDWRDGGDAGIWDFDGETNPIFSDFPNYFDPSANSFQSYINNKSLPQINEIMQQYDNLCEIWFDTPIHISPEQSFLFYQAVFYQQPSTLVTQRIGNEFGDIGTPGDNVIPEHADQSCWEGIATTNNSWGIKSYDHDWKSPQELLYWLVENCSKGGNFLLNVGPTAQGIIPQKCIQNLTLLGEWLAINGKAIYDSKPWRVSHEGPTVKTICGTEDREEHGFSEFSTAKDFWFTSVGDFIYVIAFIQPANRQVLIKSLKNETVESVKLLGHDLDLEWRQHEDGLYCRLSEKQPNKLGYVLEIKRSGNR